MTLQENDMSLSSQSRFPFLKFVTEFIEFI